MKKHTAKCEHHKDGLDFCTVGIDVSKHHLDACELPEIGAWACSRVARVV